ncbi:MAG: hypothetical protein DRM98_03485 [Thermoplasmata archaeon]|nr:MAG: hypothetical protein DRM98_03485 [Thermoplasmata archaeon]
MKIKALVSLLIALAMIASTSSFVVGAGDDNNCSGVSTTSEETYPFGEIIKEVNNGSGWADSVYADIGDTLRFRITIIYHETGHPDASCVRSVYVNDTLPDCLEYAGGCDPNYIPTHQSGKIIRWYFQGPYWKNESGMALVEVIEFNATVVGYTDEDGEENFVEVEGLEKCSSRPLYGNATATVIVKEQECGYLEVTKKVWNGSSWVDDAVVDLGVALFNITITYHAGCGYIATNIVAEDTINPNGLSYTYDSSNYKPSSITANTIVWNLTDDHDIELKDGESVSIEFEITLTAGSGTLENCVEVFALEDCCGCELYGTDCANVTVEEQPCGEIEVTKKAWDGESWVDSYNAELGETVTFNITITYHAGCGYIATNIVAEDTINPDGLSYTYDSSNYEPSSITGNTITWNLTEDHNVELEDGESVSVLLNLTITDGTGTLENCVDVSALEHCCGCELYGCDCANVTVSCEPGIEVEKKVWNKTSQAWEDYLPEIHIGETVKFKITITYYDCDTGYEILNMVVKDVLPCCLEFVETTNIYTTGEMDTPHENVTEGKVIDWNWTFDKHLVLHDGDTLTIEIDTVVTNYCECEECEGENICDNWVYVTAWGCSGPEFYGEDNVTIDCTPPVPKFFKKAKNSTGQWVDEIKVNEGETTRFKLELEYYGETALDEVRFVDVLPCILEYADNVVLNRNLTVELSEDGKTIWFNLTDDVVEDGEIVTIEFDAYVNGTTGDCDCQYVENYAYVTGKIGCVQEPNFFMNDTVRIRSGCPSGNCPPNIPSIRGPTSGLVGEELEFRFLTYDPDDDNVYYMIDFNGDTTGWLGPHSSGTEISEAYTFSEPGTYKIKAKAKDDKDHESGWTPTGYEHVIVITEAPPNKTKELTVEMSMFGFGRVTATVTNTGDIDLADINWEINATGGILKRITIYNNGTIETLNKDQSTKISSSDRMFGRGSSNFGFGKIVGTVKLTDGDYEKTHEFSGFVIGKIIIIPPVYTIQ